MSRGDGDVGVSNDLSLRPRTHSFSSASSGEADGSTTIVYYKNLVGSYNE